ncbi:MAG TPA: hypothetical protein VK307_02805 [Thermoleophilaceae bacterium]|nr:hypothetical protein [Thermoleophilaceae bacterium]
MLKSLFVFALLALAVPLTVLAVVGAERDAGAARALPAPAPTGPDAGTTVQSAPVFSWRPVRRAAEYEFQLSDDADFRSVVGGGSGETANTAFTLDDSLPDGDYDWRVRALTADGDAGRWSRTRSFSKRWSQRPRLLAPADGATVQYPSVPLVLRWEPVPHAFKYVVTIAADPACHAGGRQRQPADRNLRHSVRAPGQPRAGRILVGCHARERSGPPRRALGDRLVQVGVAELDERERGRPQRRPARLRPPVLLAAGTGRGALRGGGERLAGLRGRLEGVLQRQDHRDVAVAGQAVPEQHLLLARARL